MKRPKIIIMASRTSGYLKYLIVDLHFADLILFSDRESSAAVKFAKEKKIKVEVCHFGSERRSKIAREMYDLHIGRLVASKKPDLVILAGWLHIFTQRFLDQFPPRTVMNLHAALLPIDVNADSILLPDNTSSPIFRGLNSVNQALQAKVSFTGSTVHWVTSEVDKGEVILQKFVKIDPTDNLETLSRKLFQIERILLTESVHIVLKEKGFYI
jgi:phosphoribosylglycinamide formyltransferase-1